MLIAQIQNISDSSNVVDLTSKVSTISPISTIGRLIEIGAGAVLAVGGLAVLFFLVKGGFDWITAGGDKSKIETARNEVVQAIIGLALLASAFAIYRIVIKVFGLDSEIRVSGGGSSTSGGSNGADCSDWCAGDNQCLPAGGHRVSRMCSYAGCSDPNTYPCKIGN